MSTAFVFPGQGSQSIGMLGALAVAEPLVQHTFEEASEVLGYDLWQRVSAGPAELLNATECTQPAMLAAGVATWRVWQKAGGPVPSVVLGHSLGEFTALTVAGALEFAAAVRLVQTRGRLMQAAVPQGRGGMAAILGLEDAQVVQACEAAAQGEVVQAVNFNSPGQVVIAGHATAVARAIEKAKALGAKRALPLPISVPSHSSLMEAASDELGVALTRADLRNPTLAFWSPADAAPHSDADALRALLQIQLARPVHWTDTIRMLAAQGVTRFIECGPGKVLTSLNRRIEKRPEIQCMAIDDPATLAAALAAAPAAVGAPS
jgi:[acyl-carrier-protein] S-malonyltransferase